jgi:AcrR family transcriptional regulator
VKAAELSGPTAGEDAGEAGQSRDRILDAAEELMLADGYERASISRICRRSGLPNGSLYHYFGSKAGLLAAIMERGADRVSSVLPDVYDTAGSAEDRMRRYWAAAAAAIAANISYFNLEIDLVRLSHEDPVLATVLPGVRAVAEHGLALMIEPFAREAGVEKPETLAGRLAALTVTFTRGAVLGAGADVARLHQDIDDLYLVIHSTVMHAARHEGTA